MNVLDLPDGVPFQWTVGVALVAICWAIWTNAFGPICWPSWNTEPVKNVEGSGEEIFTGNFKMPCFPHLEIALHPPCGFHRGNPTEPYRFENDLCYGEYLFFHPPTDGSEQEPARNSEPGRLNYGEYFRGKTRIWELRIRFQFKVPPNPEYDLFFGTESEEYVPLSAAAKQVLALAVGTVRTAVSGLYHTPGDDPLQVPAGEEVEKPCFMLPLWAFDQFIQTPEGEDPPDLMDSNFPQMGSRRYGRSNRYAQEMTELRNNIQTGSTYTFAFWGTSRFADIINWRLVGMPVVGPIDLNRFIGRPPLHCVLYEIAPHDQGEKRHLQSRKRYFFKASIWSSLRRPTRQTIERLTGIAFEQPFTGETQSSKGRSRIGRSGFEYLMGRAAYGCCGGR